MDIQAALGSLLRELSAKLTEGVSGRKHCFLCIISFFCSCIGISIVAFGSAEILVYFRFAMGLRWAADPGSPHSRGILPLLAVSHAPPR